MSKYFSIKTQPSIQAVIPIFQKMIIWCYKSLTWMGSLGQLVNEKQFDNRFESKQVFLERKGDIPPSYKNTIPVAPDRC